MNSTATRILNRLNREFEPHEFLFVPAVRKEKWGIPSVIPQDEGKGYYKILLDGKESGAIYDDWALEDIRLQAPEVDTEDMLEEMILGHFTQKLVN